MLAEAMGYGSLSKSHILRLCALIVNRQQVLPGKQDAVGVRVRDLDPTALEASVQLCLGADNAEVVQKVTQLSGVNVPGPLDVCSTEG